MYNNRVLIGNWYEENIGKFVSQKDGNKDSTYQTDYRGLTDLPAQDNIADTWKIQQKLLVITTNSTYNIFCLE